MNIKELILKQIEKKHKIKVSDIVKMTGFSRAYINRYFKELKDEGHIILVGNTNRAYYIPANKKAIQLAKRQFLNIEKKLKNINLSEDTILDSIKKETGIFLDMKENITNIVDYAFTEMLNNAIEHSASKTIEIIIKKDSAGLRFEITDKGVGIFNNIIQKKKLKNVLEAIQDLLKGKQTTDPQRHSGEGIFFTSKIGDTLIIESSNKKLIFNNILKDEFVSDIKNRTGTKIIFTISLKNKLDLKKIFEEYSEGTYNFVKTSVKVKLYKASETHISRSQARRILVGLEKFKIVELDFKNIKTIGQGFADEIFRVWHNHNPNIKIIIKNSNENINFMIKRAQNV